MKLFRKNKAQEGLEIQRQVQEQTMKHISREIHDNIGQVLSLVKLHLNSIQVFNNPQAVVMINRSVDLVNKALSELRNLSNTIDHGYISTLGLIPAVRADLEIITGSGISASLILEGTESSLGWTEVIIYRIIQECLNNIIKHANATNILIKASYGKDAFSIAIIDNGKGFDSSLIKLSANSINGSGIQNIMDRASLIGAQVNVDSAQGLGTKFYLSLPVCSQV